MSPMDTILGRIKKLLALTVDRGATPDEAASAAAKAQSLLFEHNLSMSAVNTHEIGGEKDEEIENIIMDIDEGSASTLNWKRRLLNAVVKNNFCAAVFLSGTETVHVIGKRSNVIVCEYMSEYLEAEISRLAKIAARAIVVKKASFVSSFCLGAVVTVEERLKEQASQNEQSSDASRALVVQSKGAIEVARKKFFPRIVPMRTKSRIDAYGFSSGKVAGQSIGLNKGIGNSKQASLLLG